MYQQKSTKTMVSDQISQLIPIKKNRSNKPHQPPLICSTPQPMIADLYEKIITAYKNLEQSYLTSHTKNENYLLTIYLKILDKILDEVVYAQQKVNMVDSQTLKQQKIVEYLKQIKDYKYMCQNYKDLLNQKEQQLSIQISKTKQLQSQRDQLKQVQVIKNNQLQSLKIMVKNFKMINLSNKINNNDKFPQIQEQKYKEINQKQRHKFFNQSRQNQFKIKLSQKRKQFQASKSIHLHDQQFQGQNNTFLKKKQSILVSSPQQLCQSVTKNTKKPDKLSTTLWLYQPSSSYRNRKFSIKQDVGGQTIKHKSNEKSKQKQKYIYSQILQKDQISTKRGSQIANSNNLPKQFVSNSMRRQKL